MNRKRRDLAGLIALGVVVAAVPATASAKTVTAPYDGQGYSLVRGDALRVVLNPADASSSGYHWRVANQPARSVLRLRSDRTKGKRQVFTYSARGAGATKLAFKYVPPGRRAKATKTFRIAAAVNSRTPKLDCNASGRAHNTVVESGSARVFSVKRRVFYTDRAAFLYKTTTDAYFACQFAQRVARPLVENPLADNGYSNVTLRGVAVGFVYQPECEFSQLVEGGCVAAMPKYMVSQDVRSGAPIREVMVGDAGGIYRPDVTGLVMSVTGGLAWIEKAKSPDDGLVHNRVFRSDAPAVAGEKYAGGEEVLDQDEDQMVDSDSLAFDGTDVTWRHGDIAQRAPLR
jgi:hypothetical protein